MKGKARLDRPDKVENVSEAFISDLNNSARIADARGKSALTVESGLRGSRLCASSEHVS